MKLTFAQLLRNYRGALNVTRLELSQTLQGNLSVQTIYNIENSLAPIPLKHIRLVSEKLKIPRSVLYEAFVEWNRLKFDQAVTKRGDKKRASLKLAHPTPRKKEL